MSKFTCICGKEFDNPQAFNGHKSHCVPHLQSTGRLEVRQQVDAENKQKISRGVKAKFAADRLAAAERWKEERHACEKCGVIMEIKYGSGRFCSRQCANSKTHSAETKQKIREASRRSFAKGLYPQLTPEKTRIHSCIVRTRTNSKQLREQYKLSPSHCSICGVELPYERRDKQTCSRSCYKKLLSKTGSAAAQRKGGNLNPYGVRGTAKYGTYKGLHCDSSWELAYAIYCLDHDIIIERNTDGFEYTYNNQQHIYYPDFIVDGKYIEIKNFNNDQVQAKIKGFPQNKELIVLFKPDMKPYLDYCTKTYGKNFVDMYDADKPSWKERKQRKSA
jgi:hypothetical protein